MRNFYHKNRADAIGKRADQDAPADRKGEDRMRTQERIVTPEGKEAFESDGFFVLRGALTPEEVARYRDALARVLRTPEDHTHASRLLTMGLSAEQCPPDNPRGVWAGFDLPLFDDGFY